MAILLGAGYVIRYYLPMITEPYLVIIGAFIAASLAALLVYFLSFIKGASPITIILAGVAVMFVFSTGTSLIQYFSGNPDVSHAIVMWMLGSVTNVTLNYIPYMALSLLAIPYYVLISWRLNALNLGDDVAHSLGINVRNTRLAAMLAAAFQAAATISFVGLVGFVDLVIPNIARALVGSDNRYLIPASALMGADITVLADVVSKTLIPPYVIPIGVVLSMIGAPPYLLTIIISRGGLGMVMSKAVLEVRDLECGYDRPVIRDVNINVDGGGLVVLMGGPNGAGKSTLIKCILGVARVFSGSIRVNGKDALRMDRREIAKLVSYVPQNHAVAYPVRVFDAVLLGRLPHMGFRPSKLDIDTALNAMRRLGIEHLANKLVTRLSGGEAQLVHIARAIAQGGGVLMLLDEPTSNLDLKHQVAVMETLIRIAREDGIAVLVTMHDINLALKYADRIYVMREGRIVAELSPGDISPSIIEEVYGGVKTTVIEHNGRPVVIV